MGNTYSMIDPIPVLASGDARLEEPARPANPYWARVASAYAEMRPPLRPSGEDIRFFEQAVAGHALLHSEAKQTLLLGVTPDIAAMRLPASWSLLGIDCSHAMVKGVWPGNLPGKRWGINGDWLALPAISSSCDVVVGDGSMNCLRYPEQHHTFARSVRSVLKPEGIFILRCFAQLEKRESPDQVFEDVRHGRIPTFTQFRYRLLMAMQPSAKEGIAIKSVYRFWTDRVASDPLLLSRAGWPKRDVDVIELYRDGGAVHTFPTLAECRATLSEFFDEISVSFPSYYGGDRCPRLVLTPRRRGG